MIVSIQLVDQHDGPLPGLKGVEEEGCQPVRASIVTVHHTVQAGPHVAVSDLQQPQRCLRLSAEQPGGDVVETPGSGEVDPVQVDQLAVSLVSSELLSLATRWCRSSRQF